MIDFRELKTYHLNEEVCWEYSCSFLFNDKQVNYLTITNHFQKKHKNINKEKILELISNLDGKKITYDLSYLNKKVFIWETEDNLCKKYRLIFWLKDQTTNHLWIRNCYRVD